MSETKYINQSLLEGLSVLKKFMADLSPFTWYSVHDLQQALGKDFDYQKTFRIVKTLQSAGFVDIDSSGKRYQLSREVIALSYKFLQALKREHENLKQIFDQFKIE